MNRAPRTFQEIVDLWSSVAEFARSCGVADATVRAWLRRDNIPSNNWIRLVTAARQLGIHGVSLEVLAGAELVAIAAREELRRREAAGLPPACTTASPSELVP